MRKNQVIGVNVRRLDTLAKVCGQAKYAADIQRPGTVYGRIVRSPHARALIQGIVKSDAEAYPGVLAVLTAADVPGINAVGPRGVRDQPVIAEHEVNFAGEAVAVVVAESVQAANMAAGLVRVLYEPLEPVTNPEQSLRADDPFVHAGGNLCHQLRIVRGDFNSALQKASLVLTNTYRTQFVDHSALEPDAIVAEPDGDGVVLWVTSKSPHHDREEIAHALGLPPTRVRVAVAAVGGSFGGKPDLPLLCIAGMIALWVHRPIKIVFDREECFSAKTKRHPYTMKYTHAVAADGEILGVKADIIADAGAYSSYSVTVISKGIIHAAGPYRVPNVEMTIRAGYTNNPVTGAMRGYGVPQVVFAVERQMDIIAKKLGLDPIDLRLKNALRPGDRTVTGQVVEDVALPELLLQAKKRMSDRAQAVEGLKGRRASGVAAFYYGCGRTAVEDMAKVSLQLEKDGSVHLFVGSPDTGQGSDTALAQIAAEALGLDFGLMRLTSGDTGTSFDSGTSTASRVTYVVGNAVQRAASSFREHLLDVASEMQGRKVLQLDSDAAFLSRLFHYCEERNIETEATGTFQTATGRLDQDGQGAPYGAYTYGVQVSDILIDPETGKVNVEQTNCCYDGGTIVNPVLFRAQIEGGTIMAQGYTLTEDLALKDGVATSTSFHTYLIPTALDGSPIGIDTVESFEGTGPFGAKGIGEPTTLPGAASIANAISTALGKEFFELPLTAERILIDS